MSVDDAERGTSDEEERDHKLMSAIRITGARITPVAFVDPPLLNTVGVHQPYALRAIIQLDTDAGLVGLGETYADTRHLARLETAAAAITGLDVFALNTIRAAIAERLRGDDAAVGTAGMIMTASAVDQVFSPFEVACLDVQGHATGRPVSDLLGGLVRPAVPFSAYLFYKWAAHPGSAPDSWGEALDPAGIVAQAKRMIDEYGFTAIKLKGGVFPPEEEMAAIEALRAAFPNHPLRLDPNAAWTPQTSVKVASGLAGILEYLEDPTPDLDGMAEVAAQSPMPLATNMCVVAFDQLAPAVAKKSVGVVLSDHHYWGGLHRSRLLAGICENFGLGLSMHSNSHLGISLAAMVHLAGATPNLSYACDTHWPWKTEEIIKPGVLEIVDGSVAVPTGPGLGIEIDDAALAALHEQYLRCGIRDRDDTGYMKSIDPTYELVSPRW
jgi:glucarate dehydratase